MRMSKFGPLRWLAMVHISLMRGIPLMVLLFFIYFGLPFMGLQLDAITASIIAFTSMSSAYISEIIRASLSAIDKGQWEAARSLGLRTNVIYRKIIIPQAFRIALPPLSNVLLDMVKSTSLTAMITVPEIFNKAKIVGGAKSDYMTVYICVALIYWVICTLYAFGQLQLENAWRFIKNSSVLLNRGIFASLIEHKNSRSGRGFGVFEILHILHG